MLIESVRRCLALWALSPRTDVRLINRSENTVFRLDDPEGMCLALRVHRPGYNSAAAIASELDWITALRRDRVLDTPAPVAGIDGDLVQRLASGHHAVAFAFVAGAEPPPGSAWFSELGRITACLHAHALGWARPAGFVRRRWDAEAMFDAGAVWGPWRVSTGLDAAGIDVLTRGEALIRERLARFGQGIDRFGLIHGDLRVTNLLAEQDRLHVIDFDDCGFGWFAYDFAAAVSFFEDAPEVPVLLDAWAEGYRRVRPLAADQLAEMPVFVAGRRLLLTAWLASHPGGAPVGDDFVSGTVAVLSRLLSGTFLK